MPRSHLLVLLRSRVLRFVVLTWSGITFLTAIAQVPPPAPQNISFRPRTVAITGKGGLSRLSRTPSINNRGTVAFLADTIRADGETFNNAYSWQVMADGTGLLRPMFNEGLLPKAPNQSPVNSVPPVWQLFDDMVQVNDASQVLALRNLRASIYLPFEFPPPVVGTPATFNYLEIYNALASNQTHVQQRAFGKGANILVSFLAPLWAGANTWDVTTPDQVNIASPYTLNTPMLVVKGGISLNNKGEAAYVGLRSLAGPTPENYLCTSTASGQHYNGPFPGDVYPKLADNGNLVTVSPSGAAILMINSDLTDPSVKVLASASLGYSAVGRYPGISDDGRVVVFLGRRTLKQGSAEFVQNALFLATDLLGLAFTSPMVLAGVSGNHLLEPGETFVDQPRLNSAFDAGWEIDTGPWTSFDFSAPVCVQRNSAAGGTTRYTVLFRGERLGRQQATPGIYAIDVNLSRVTRSGSREPLSKAVMGFGPVVTQEQTFDNRTGESYTGGSIRPRAVATQLGDGLSTSGDVVTWVSLEDGTEIIHTWAPDRGNLEVVDANDSLTAAPPRGFYLPVAAQQRGAGRPVEGACADGNSRLILRTPPEWRDAYEIRVRVTDEDGVANDDFNGRVEAASDARGVVRYYSGRGSDQAVWQPGQLAPSANGICNFIYRAPADFVRTGTTHESDDKARGGLNHPRLITITAVASTGEQEMARLVTTLRLYRPPVVLLHGLHDCADSWAWTVRNGDPRFYVESVNYSESNGDHLRDSIPRVEQGIRECLSRYRAEYDIAATQVDAFGHSMGGILLRMFACDQLPEKTGSFDHFRAMNTGYCVAENYQAGYLHKLVLVDSPQFGSQICNFLRMLVLAYPFEGYSYSRQTYSDLRRWMGRDPGLEDPASPCRNACLDSANAYFQKARDGALEDLDPGSAALKSILATPVDVPVHAITGSWVQGVDPDSTCAYAATKLALLNGASYLAGKPGFTLDDLFFGPNDAAVAEESQNAGLPPWQRTRVRGPEGLHYPTMHEYPDGPSARAALRLLDASVRDRIFGTLPAYDQVPVIPVHSPLRQGPLTALNLLWAAEGVWQGRFPLDTTIFGWLPGSALASSPPQVTAAEPPAQPGFWVRLPPLAGTDWERGVFVDSLGNLVRFQVGEWTPIPVPAGFQGEYTLSGLVESRDGTARALLPARLGTFRSLSPLRGLRWATHELSLLTTDTGIFPNLIGLHEDGVERALNGASFGTIYRSSDTNVVEVDRQGQLLIHDDGMAYIDANNGDLRARLTVFIALNDREGRHLSFAHWSSTLASDQRGAMDDPFEAGLPNAYRYAFGIEKAGNASQGNLPSIRDAGTTNGPSVVLEYRLANYVDPGSVAVETSTDLVHWIPLQSDPQDPAITLVSIGDRRQLKIPAGPSHQYFRVTVDLRN